MLDYKLKTDADPLQRQLTTNPAAESGIGLPAGIHQMKPNPRAKAAMPAKD
jgi:hypothetical protein